VKRCDGERFRENKMFVLIYARREHGRHACIKDMQVPLRIYRGWVSGELQYFKLQVRG
jgi:hypothetical protein